MIRTKLLSLLAYTRIPGNAFSFWVRKTLRWSRGCPPLYQESKDNLFAYLTQGRDEAEARAAELQERYHLEPLARLSTAPLYRKNLYLLDILEQAATGLSFPSTDQQVIKALDVGAQDWYYVFALERWLQSHNRQKDGEVHLTGIELDGYEIYADFYTRRDYALAHANQTGNPYVRYQTGDFLEYREGEYDIIFLFYPLLLRYQLLLWGLPLRYFQPQRLLAQAATSTRPGGWLVVFCHTLREHAALKEFAAATHAYRLLREGQVLSNLVNFQGEVDDSRFSIWKKIQEEPQPE